MSEREGHFDPGEDVLDWALRVTREWGEEQDEFLPRHISDFLAARLREWRQKYPEATFPTMGQIFPAPLEPAFPRSPAIYEWPGAPLRFDPGSGVVWVEGQLASITPTQNQMMGILARRPYDWIGYDEVLKQLWDADSHDAYRTKSLRVHIHGLRRRIEPDPGNPQFIHTRHSYSRKFELPAGIGHGHIMLVPDPQGYEGKLFSNGPPTAPIDNPLG